MSVGNYPVVPFDPEVEAALSQRPAGGEQPLTPAAVPQMREMMLAMIPDPQSLDLDGVECTELVIPGPDGNEVPATLLRPASARAATPALVNFHGGGMIMGNRFMDSERLLSLVRELGVSAVNIEYRLAPEHPHPAGVEDCYAATAWIAQNVEQLGVNPEQLIVMGGSAGGLLAAAVSLIARDRGGPALAGQLLLCPMLDDRNQTPSSYQYDGVGTWQRKTALFSWECLLGSAAGGPVVDAYAAPARAGDLSGLPPAFIEIGSAEMFRDESVDYASRIWAAGGAAELVAWSGGCHGFDVFAPESELTAIALKARSSWLRRTLGLKGQSSGG